MNLSITVDTGNRRILWVGPSLLRALDIELSEIVGRSIVDLADRASKGKLARLFAGPPWTDDTFDNLRVVIPRPRGPVALGLRSVRYIDRPGAHVAFVRFDRSVSDESTASSTGGRRARSVRMTPPVNGTARGRPDTQPNGEATRLARIALGGHLDDDLSGLPLRAALFAQLDSAPVEDSSVVVVVDIDQFGQLNARLGSDAGDEILVEFGARLAASVRGGDFAARLSGDRFGVLGAVGGVDEARVLAARVERVLAEPFEVDGSLISIAASIGAAWGRNTGRARSLFHHAEMALDEAQTGGGRQLRFLDVTESRAEWADLASFAVDVRSALAAGQISVAYQPIVELSTGRLEKLEALARWEHPERGAISPVEFIPLAERSATIGELGAWILDRSCADMVRLADHGIDVEISVNMSVAQLRDPELTSDVADVIASHGIDPGRMWIEVTESVLLDDLALAPLHRLHDLGVHLVIDDFGTGYATFQSSPGCLSTRSRSTRPSSTGSASTRAILPSFAR